VTVTTADGTIKTWLVNLLPGGNAATRSDSEKSFGSRLLFPRAFQEITRSSLRADEPAMKNTTDMLFARVLELETVEQVAPHIREFVKGYACGFHFFGAEFSTRMSRK
jgi:hypothetical protein